MSPENRFLSFGPRLILLIFTGYFCIPSYGQAEYVDISPLAGIHFGGRARFYEGDIRIDDAFSYGITLSAPVNWGVAGELSYSRSESLARFIPFRSGYEPAETKIATNYFMIGAMKELVEGSAIPFGGLTLGVAWFDVKDPNINDVVRFAFSLNGGVKYMVSERVGLRVQGRLLFPVYFAGGGFYCGIGGGGSSCGVSLGSGTSFIQGDISGGIIIRLGGPGDY